MLKPDKDLILLFIGVYGIVNWNTSQLFLSGSRGPNSLGV